MVREELRAMDNFQEISIKGILQQTPRKSNIYNEAKGIEQTNGWNALCRQNNIHEGSHRQLKEKGSLQEGKVVQNG